MAEMFANVGERIKQILNQQKMKQVNLSKKTGLSANAISTYINNLRIPDTEAIYKISKALNTSMEWLLMGEGEMFQQEQLEPLPLVMDFEIDELDAEQKELLFLFAHLGDMGKYAVKDFARYQLETLPRNAPIERPKRAEKSPCFRPSGSPENGVDSA